ncbi:MAG: GDP-perosamine synthase [Verrucomicrobia subdivision 3 bacterium]|nr:GDP-perosamine synthase [Limisphaerales bacterium]MCS1416288.1 GDP-perosamine synthase [Limisphaerales bacterium]
MKREFPTWPSFSDREIEAVGRILRSGKVNYWTGSEGKAFEREYAAAVGSRFGIALANGSVALDLALKAVGVTSGDEVIVSPRSFIASASCVALCGAQPVFADVDLDSGNITGDTLRAVLSDQTKAVIPVHLGGMPCDMEDILSVAREHGLAVIEDCAQAHGAAYRGKPVGSFGDVGAFSFCQDKIISTGGEGGLVVTDREHLWKRMWAYKDHGKSYDTVFNKQHPPGFRWLHESFGTNWRMTEIQAALGRIQLTRLDEAVSVRQRNAAILTETLKDFDCVRVPTVGAEFTHSYYRYCAYLRPEQLKMGWDRDRIMNAITEGGVPCFSGTCSEIYREKAFEIAGTAPAERLPNARMLGDLSLMFPVYSTLSVSNMEFIASGAREVLTEASK